MIKVADYEEAVKYCLELPKFTKKNEIEITRNFLSFLNVENIKATVIHVAGTNGKGSVCAFLQAIAMDMGKRVASFTSPHLCDIRERIRINDKLILEEEFYLSFQYVMKKMAEFRRSNLSCRNYHPSFFELMFFIAMTYFEKESPEIIILETGLGGRLDATNVVSRKDISIITKIGYDHMQFLGDSLSQIASEKAGIISKCVPVVFWDKNKEITNVIKNAAAKIESPCIKLSNDLVILKTNHDKVIDFSYDTRYYGYVDFTIKSKAIYQVENALLAIATAEELWHKEMTQLQLQNGVYNMHHEGRMEEVLPDIYLDGAHNQDGIAAFLETVKENGKNIKNHNKKHVLLFSVVRDKQYNEMVKMILESHLFNQIVIAPIDTDRGLTEDELKNIFSECSYVIQYPTIEKAWKCLLKNKDEYHSLYVAGSLYLVGKIKKLLAE